ncbi:MAG: lipoprotein [Proteobacteria bacterium]|nr:lipoprotein [Pseudomonadota bacterium]
MRKIMDRKRVLALVLCAGVVSLAACGVKSSPDFPKDGNYPRQYPNPGEQTNAPSSYTTPGTAPYPAPGTVSTEKTKDGAPSPLGFPLEYPNRPSYN